MLSPDEVTIEPMRPEDIEDILSIEQASFDDPWTEDTFRSELRHCWSQCRVLRRREDGRVVGYLVFWTVVDEVHLLNLAVKPGERHHQKGRMLLDYLVAYACEHHARFITLEVRRSNEAAISLYERGGFRQVGVRPSYYQSNGEDAVVMLYDCGSNSNVAALPAASEG